MANYRNPNGYGSVVKLSGNRRRPFAARKTVGYDDRAYPIYEIVGYYETRKDAMLALAQYNAKPYDISLSKSTFSQLYDLWSKDEFPQMSDALKTAHRAAYKHCERLYNKTYKDIRKAEMQRCIDDCGRSYATQTNIRNLFVQLDKFAFDNDIISKCYSSNLTTAEKNVKIKRQLFTDDEVKKLYDHIGEDCIDETLFMLFTGCRVTEMLTLTQSNINYDNNTICFGIKTAAGKNRIVPIHDRLLPILKAHKDEQVFEKRSYYMFNFRFNKMLARFGMTHTTHDARHTVRSKLDSADANKVCIDLIIGHKTGSIGERVYTHKTIEELRAAMSKLSYGL
jgi:integrase